MMLAAIPIDDPSFDQEIPMHETVMREEVIQLLGQATVAGLPILDVTAGWGGHSAAILETFPVARVIATDRDPEAVAASTKRLECFGGRGQVLHAAFSEVENILLGLGVQRVGGIVADLGVSTPQLSAPRGMSLKREGPIDMRMDPTKGETALEVIQRLSQDDLANVIYRFGEERRSRRVARCIKQALAQGDLHTTLDLRRAVVRAVGPRRVGGIDPATRTFQALRIAVNRELEQLNSLMTLADRWVAPGGVMAVISFHSLEDRIVKGAFKQREIWERLTRKPLKAGAGEQESNPRSRSAKLRGVRRSEVPALG